MAGTAVRRRLGSRWRPARLAEAHAQTTTARTLLFEVPGWPEHLAGQHVDVRLTAEDGYTAVRSYSLSAPSNGELAEITVQLVENGEVSTYLVGDMQPGDSVELLGPLGGWFVWRPGQPEPVLLVGGGSGVAPLMAVLRTHTQAGSTAPMRLLYSARTPDDVYFANELTDHDAVLLYTRQSPPRHPRIPHRIDAHDIADHAWPASSQPTCYVCGPTPFVETVIDLLLKAGHDTSRIRAERFGDSGG